MKGSKNDKGLSSGVESGLSSRAPCGEDTKRTGQSKMEGIPSACPSKKADGHTIK